MIPITPFSIFATEVPFSHSRSQLLNRGSDKMGRRSLYNPPLLSRQKRYLYIV